MGVVSAIPNEWRSTITGRRVHVDPHPFFENSFRVRIRGEMFDLSSVSSKTLYREFRSLISHILLLAKFYIYRSKLDNTKPPLEVFKAKLKAIFNIEFLIAKRNGKLVQHYKKWDSFISVLAY
ncbi:hypothetical protein P5673_007610, partial [Acropora cervicornis]